MKFCFGHQLRYTPCRYLNGKRLVTAPLYDSIDESYKLQAMPDLGWVFNFLYSNNYKTIRDQSLALVGVTAVKIDRLSTASWSVSETGKEVNRGGEKGTPPESDVIT